MRNLLPIVAVASLAYIAVASPPVLGQNTTPTSVDQTFVTQVVHANDREIDQARAELAATSDESVKLFARTMIKDHTAANAQVASIARSLNLTYPSSHIATGMSGTPPPDRPNPAVAMAPRDYMAMQVTEHQAALGLMQGEANNGSAQQLKTFAAQTMPLVQAHLAMAQQYLQSGTVTPETTPTP